MKSLCFSLLEHNNFLFGAFIHSIFEQPNTIYQQFGNLDSKLNNYEFLLCMCIRLLSNDFVLPTTNGRKANLTKRAYTIKIAVKTDDYGNSFSFLTLSKTPRCGYLVTKY